MNFEEFNKISSNTRNSIIDYRNNIDKDYKAIDKVLFKLKNNIRDIAKNITSLVLVVSLISGGVVAIGVKNKNEKNALLSSNQYSIHEYNIKKVDWVAAYIGYILCLVIIYCGLSYSVGESIIKKFIDKMKNNINEYNTNIKSAVYLFRDMEEDIMYLLAYISQYERLKSGLNKILSDNPYLEGDELINRICDTLNNLDIEEIIKDVQVKKKIMGK